MSIYKYVSIKRIDILVNEHIRFTQPPSFNDPFDTYPYFKAVARNEQVNNYFNSNEWWNDQANEKILNDSWTEQQNKFKMNIPFEYVKHQLKETMVHFQPFIKDLLIESASMKKQPFREAILENILRAINNTIGIFCLTENPNNLLMWAHYADSYKGLCIEFDEKNKFFDQRNKDNEFRNHLRKVTYSQNRPEVILFNAGAKNIDLDSWMKQIFWTKCQDWEYEKEWRIIKTLDECKTIKEINGEKIYLFPLPIDAIKGIILGCKMENEYRKKIVTLLSSAKYSHIVKYQAELHERNYYIEIKTI
ncbi:MAG: DUF2971 domain-containing protein [Deltaproteobacteria bacterium]|nr:DUF2971 domain-containing protein [Deltaproteobacteria bacterium]